MVVAEEAELSVIRYGWGHEQALRGMYSRLRQIALSQELTVAGHRLPNMLNH